MRYDISPPKAKAIRVENGEAILDEHGNVIGGVRSPYVDVPASTWNGNSTGESFCRIAGHEIPFDNAKLKALYGSHSRYVEAVTDSVNELVAAGFIVEEDGEQVIREAEQMQSRFE